MVYKSQFSHFTKFIQTANNVCIYRLNSEYISSKLQFPNAYTLTLIRCSDKGVYNILKPSIFPNLTRINYLSLDPGDVSIYKRFSRKVSWIFPMKQYDFYDCMLYAGLGKKDSRLITSYISSSKYINNNREYDLYIPDYGIVDGDVYRYFFLHLLNESYFMKNKPLSSICIPQNFICNTEHYNMNMNPLKKYYKDKIDRDFFETLLQDSNHPDATLFRNLDK
jgi:hypothetical protein